jgi:hypothetical protein
MLPAEYPPLLDKQHFDLWPSPRQRKCGQAASQSPARDDDSVHFRQLVSPFAGRVFRG